MMLLLFSSACADAGSWVCSSCGQSGNTGNFCPNCGAPAPSDEWTCAVCGHSGNTGNFCINCGSQKNAVPSNTGNVNQHLEQIPGESDNVKVCLQNVEASSYIENVDEPLRWIPENAVDNNESTCWQFSAKFGGLNGKTWLRLNAEAAQAVDEIWFKNGFWGYSDKGTDQFPINSRLKKIRISFLYQGESVFRDEFEHTLKDENRQGWQKVSTGHRENVVSVRISAWTMYKGSRFPNDVCLSEVILVQHASASKAKAPSAAGQARVYESRPDVSGCGLLMKLATRSGPGTEYDEPGTFFGNNWKNVNVRVLGKSWDGSIWWVLVDFDNGGKASYRVWTGLKRVDVDPNKLKEIYPKGQGTVNSTSETYRGPGGRYAKAKVTINGWKDVLAYGKENGYVEVEFTQGKKTYRLWVPEKETSIDWN